MVIVQLKGGLGNQLFQYAAALSLAKHHNSSVKVDVNELVNANTNDTLRNYELKNLVVAPEIATEAEIKAVKNLVLLQWLQKGLPSYQRSIYNEKTFEFDKNFFNAGSNIYLKGYRQSEQYFKPIAEQIRKDFRLKPRIVQSVQDWANIMQNENSVSVHIRRGDYTNAKVQQVHGFAGKTYYEEAIATMKSRLGGPKFFVFSDEPAWVKANLSLPADTLFVSNQVTTNHYEDFYLMSCCQNNVIANSSFSWWAAWLNPNLTKTVIAPKRWFNNDFNSKDLVPDQWMKL